MNRHGEYIRKITHKLQYNEMSSNITNHGQTFKIAERDRMLSNSHRPGCLVAQAQVIFEYGLNQNIAPPTKKRQK